MNTPRKAQYILWMLLLTLLCLPLWSAFIKDHPHTITQPDGRKIDCFVSGDEYHNWIHDAKGYTIIQSPQSGFYTYALQSGSNVVASSYIVGDSDPSSLGLTPKVNISEGEYKRLRATRFTMPAHRDAPTTGTINNIVIYIRFSDQSEFGENISTYDGWFNSNTSSMKNYFLEVSYNALTVNSSFYPPAANNLVVSWQDSQPRAYYSPYNASTNPIGYNGDAQRTSREFTLLQNATNGVAAQIPSGLNVDADNDGYVDNVVYIVRGATDGWSSLLWPHRWAIYDRSVYINSKRVYDFNFQLQNHMAGSNVGVLCHEFFHSLGAPDLYRYVNDDITPVGQWDLMEWNTNPPQHMGAYMKWKYGGWISSIPTISANQAYSLNPATSSTGIAYRINSPYSSTEYFVVEFRKRSGTFENSLPGSGLLAYRINTSAGDGNASGPPDEVYIYRPGGTTTVDGTINSANFSTEVGRTAINHTTNPTPFLSTGAAGGLSLYNIGSSAGSTMSFTKGDPPIVTIDFSTNPYTVPFDEATFPPDGWVNSAIVGSYVFERSTSGSYPTVSPQAGAGMLTYQSYNASNGNSAVFVSPRLNISSITTYTYETSFWMYRDDGYPSNTDRIEVYTNSTANLDGSPTLLGTINRSRNLSPSVGSNGWYQYSYDLTFPATGYYYLIFKAVSAYGNNMYLDGFTINRTTLSLPPNPATSPSPANAASGIALNTNLTWASGGGSPTGYRLYLGTNNPPSNIVSNQNLGLVTSYTPSNLQYSTTYYWQIVPYNSAGNASSCPVWSFTTIASPFISSFPYTESFEAGNTNNSSIIANWTQTRDGGLTQDWRANSTATSYNRTPRTGSFNLALRYSGNAWLFRGMNLVGGTSYQVELWARQDMADPSYANIGIYYGTAANIASMTATIAPQTSLTNGAYQRVYGTFTPTESGTYYLGIHGVISGTPWYLSLDDITVDLAPLGPIFAITPESKNFGSVGIGYSSAIQSFTITNEGGSALFIDKDDISIVGADAANFVLATIENDLNLAPLASATLNISFVPLSQGTKNADLRIVDNTTSKAVQLINLTGKGFQYATIPYAYGFEAGWDDWDVANDTQTNKWALGSATAYEGSNSAYISNDSGTSNAYDISASSTVHLYKDFIIPEDAANIKLKFAWKGQGEGTTTIYDYLKVYLVDPTTTPIAGSLLSSGQLGEHYNLNGEWQVVRQPLPDAIAGSIKRLVFTWRNDSSVGTQPPIAIDDIALIFGNDTDVVIGGTVVIEPEVILPPEGDPITATITISNIDEGSIINVSASYATASLPNAGLSLTLSGTAFGGATISLNPGLGFIPAQIGYRILPSDQWILVDNPGDWTLDNVSFVLPNFKADDDLEIVFPDSEGNTLPITLSSFTATLTAEQFVRLDWITQSESGTLGYYIHRANSPDLSEAEIISSLITATNSSSTANYRYVDREVVANTGYYYWLQGIDYDGYSGYYGPLSVTIGNGGEPGTPEIPLYTELLSAYPNPFNPQTNIRYSLKEDADVKIDIFNLKGQIVRSYFVPAQKAGYHSQTFDGKDSQNRALGSGVFYYRMSSGKYSSTKKMILMK